ncbi:Helicase protein MOM1 [Acorus calamus]|uniref:Helicase protein MOM1 n=1 Tax=Acorus calamus TaxID=4465 RepID=A0AAV9C3I6_ACOCL|nr:Helicase protein MOM1 [Acorus calamus]
MVTATRSGRKFTTEGEEETKLAKLKGSDNAAAGLRRSARLTPVKAPSKPSTSSPGTRRSERLQNLMSPATSSPDKAGGKKRKGSPLRTPEKSEKSRKREKKVELVEGSTDKGRRGLKAMSARAYRLFLRQQMKESMEMGSRGEEDVEEEDASLCVLNEGVHGSNERAEGEDEMARKAAEGDGRGDGIVVMADMETSKKDEIDEKTTSCSEQRCCHGLNEMEEGEDEMARKAAEGNGRGDGIVVMADMETSEKDETDEKTTSCFEQWDNADLLNGVTSRDSVSKSNKWIYLSEPSRRTHGKAHQMDSLENDTNARNEVKKKQKNGFNDTVNLVSPITWIPDESNVFPDKEAEWTRPTSPPSNLNSPSSIKSELSSDYLKKKASGSRTENLSKSSPNPCRSPVTSDSSDMVGTMTTESKGRKKRDAQKCLLVSLKPKLAKLCEILQLPDNVKSMSERLLEYTMNNYNVTQEQSTILQAFQISVCWEAASFLNYEVDHRESLTRVKEQLNYACSEEVAESIYSKLGELNKFSCETDTVPNATKSNSVKDLPSVSGRSDVAEAIVQKERCKSLNSGNEELEEGRVRERHPGRRPEEQPVLAEQVHAHDDELLKHLSRIQRACDIRMKKLLVEQQGELVEVIRIRDESKVKVKETYDSKLVLIRTTPMDPSVREKKLHVLNQNLKRKMDDLEKHAIECHRKLVVMQVNARNEEKRIRKQWEEEAKAGRLSKSFDKVPISRTGFRPDLMKMSGSIYDFISENVTNVLAGSLGGESSHHRISSRASENAAKAIEKLVVSQKEAEEVVESLSSIAQTNTITVNNNFELSTGPSHLNHLLSHKVSNSSAGEASEGLEGSRHCHSRAIENSAGGPADAAVPGNENLGNVATSEPNDHPELLPSLASPLIAHDEAIEYEHLESVREPINRTSGSSHTNAGTDQQMAMVTIETEKLHCDSTASHTEKQLVNPESISEPVDQPQLFQSPASPLIVHDEVIAHDSLENMQESIDETPSSFHQHGGTEQQLLEVTTQTEQPYCHGTTSQAEQQSINVVSASHQNVSTTSQCVVVRQLPLESTEQYRAGPFQHPLRQPLRPLPPLLPQPLHTPAIPMPGRLPPDLFQNQLSLIDDRLNVIIKEHENEKLQLISACNRKMEELQKQYNALLQDVEGRAEFSKKSLEIMRTKVRLNKLLADAMKFKFAGNPNEGTQSNQQGVPATNSDVLSHLSALQMQRTSSVPAFPPSTSPAATLAQTFTPSPLASASLAQVQPPVHLTAPNRVTVQPTVQAPVQDHAPTTTLTPAPPVQVPHRPFLVPIPSMSPTAFQHFTLEIIYLGSTTGLCFPQQI